ncbi:hypothetical protein CSUI_005526, partial [Cystoisospora suis]
MLEEGLSDFGLECEELIRVVALGKSRSASSQLVSDRPTPVTTSGQASSEDESIQLSTVSASQRSEDGVAQVAPRPRRASLEGPLA